MNEIDTVDNVKEIRSELDKVEKKKSKSHVGDSEVEETKDERRKRLVRDHMHYASLLLEQCCPTFLTPWATKKFSSSRGPHQKIRKQRLHFNDNFN